MTSLDEVLTYLSQYKDIDNTLIGLRVQISNYEIESNLKTEQIMKLEQENRFLRDKIDFFMQKKDDLDEQLLKKKISYAQYMIELGKLQAVRDAEEF